MAEWRAGGSEACARRKSLYANDASNDSRYGAELNGSVERGSASASSSSALTKARMAASLRIDWPTRAAGAALGTKRPRSRTPPIATEQRRTTDPSPPADPSPSPPADEPAAGAGAGGAPLPAKSTTKQALTMACELAWRWLVLSAYATSPASATSALTISAPPAPPAATYAARSSEVRAPVSRAARVRAVRVAARSVRISEGSAGARAASATLPAHVPTARTCVVATRRRWRASACATGRTGGCVAARPSSESMSASMVRPAPRRSVRLAGSYAGGATISATADRSISVASRCAGCDARPVGPSAV